MPPSREHRTVDRCSELREECQGKIFTKMDELHEKQMAVLSEIKEHQAYEKGLQNGKQEAPAGQKIWLAILGKAASLLIVPAIFLIALGGIYWLKVKGWL